MPMRAMWLPDVLRNAGLEVTEEPGWETRGSESWGPIKGVMCHHTATSPLAPGDYPSMRIVRDGRLPPDPSPVPGPLSQLGLGRSGRWYVIASGRANHAGLGSWPGLAGSSESIGIEAEHPGGSYPWDQNQYDSYVQGVAALVGFLGDDTIVLGHKEWAPTRKTDPTFNMDTFRTDVEEWEATMAEGFLPLALNDGTEAQRPHKRSDVAWMQAKMNRAFGTALRTDGIYGPATAAAIAVHLPDPTADGSGIPGRAFTGNRADDLDWALAVRAAASIGTGTGVSLATVRAEIANHADDPATPLTHPHRHSEGTTGQPRT